MLTTFHRQHPGVELSLVEDSSATLTRRVANGELDAAFASLTDDSPTGVHTRELTHERIAAAFSSSHPLADNGTTVSLAELAHYPLIALPPGRIGMLWRQGRSTNPATSVFARHVVGYVENTVD